MIAVEADASAALDDLMRRVERLTVSFEVQISEKLWDAALQSGSAAPGLEDGAIRDFGVKAGARELVALKPRASAFYAGAGKGFGKTERGRVARAKAPAYPGSPLPPGNGKIPSGLKAALLAALARD